MISHTGNEIRFRLYLVSSAEYWTMNESLIQRCYLDEDGFFLVVNFLLKNDNDIVLNKLSPG